MDWEPLKAPPTYPDVCVGKSLAALWENEALKDTYDFTIKVGNEEFKVHKLIMIATSHYFKAMFASDMTEITTNSVELKGLNSLAVSNIIEYIYTNKITGKRASPEYLLECAAYLQIPPAIEMASKSLKKKMNVKNCFDILHIFESYSRKCEIEFTRDFILVDFDDILEVHDILRMSYEDFCQVVDVWGNPEWDLFEAIQKWISIIPEEHKQHMNDLMSQIRFGLMTVVEIQSIVNMDIFPKSARTLSSLVKALIYLGLPIHKKVLDDSEQSKVRTIPVPVVIRTNQYDLGWELYKDGSWLCLEAHNSPGVGLVNKGAAAHVVVNNFLIICAAFAPSQEWHIFDPRTKTWSSMAKMNIPRKEFALVHNRHFLYALGGCTDNNSSVTDSIEKYNFETDTWSITDSKLPVPMQNLCACQLSGSIYIIGRFPADTMHQHQLDCFHPSTGTWESKAAMLKKRQCYWMNVVKLREEEFIHVMCDNFIMMYYNPCTDQWSMWTSFSDLQSGLLTDSPESYRDGTVLARNDTLFLLNFAYNNECNGIYEPESCIMWQLHPDRRYVREKHLEELPCVNDLPCLKEDYVACLLSFPPQSVVPE